MIVPSNKVCVACGELKPDTKEFFRPYKNTQKLAVTCKACTYRRSRELARLNAEKHPLCSVDGCTKRSSAQKGGLCDMHAQRLRNTGSVGEAEPRRHPRGTLICSHDGCDKVAISWGLCEKHYRRGLRSKLGTCKASGCGAGASSSSGLCRYHDRAAKGLICSVEGCDSVANGSLGMCYVHYIKVKNHGDPNHVHPRWVEAERKKRDGFTHKTKGYRYIYRPDHPMAREKKPYIGWMLEHRFVMSEHLGRNLEDYENVHHLNGVKTDNRLENLELWSTSQPFGQRVIDKLSWANELIAKYEPDIGKICPHENHSLHWNGAKRHNTAG